MCQKLTLLVLGTLFLALAACGGGGGGGGPPAATWVISGVVSGDAVELIPVFLGGDASAQTVTDSFGNYFFPPVVNGTYSITPSVDNVTFSPVNRIVIVADANVPGVNFSSSGTPPTPDATPPVSTVRLVYVHHTDGTSWLSTADGALGDTLGANNYFVRDVTLAWNAPQNPGIGSQIDIGHWHTWFVNETIQGNGISVRDNITGELYITNSKIAAYTPITDPGGPNEIVMIMSSYLNSGIKSDNGQPPTALYGQPASNTAHTLPNCQEVYRQILAYFKTQPDKLFVVIAAPPLVTGQTLLTDAANARTLNDWLVNNWLVEGGWEKKNVAVFDFFNVLTHEDNHHRLNAGVIEHINTNGDNFSDYGTGGSDSTPTQAGNLRGTAELPALLNVAFNRWQTWLNP